MTVDAATQLRALEGRVAPLHARLGSHPLYSSLRSIADLQLFMEAHVFAVWDFMSLLKQLQRALTGVDLPWTPSALPGSRRLVNEIVLGEESDLFNGQPLSHFEIYRTAMQQCGASTSAIDHLQDELRRNPGTADIGASLRRAGAPDSARQFVEDTFRIIGSGEVHAVAAAFTFGREDLIPEMFKGFVRDLNTELAGQLSTFIWYLERHIEVDGDEHGPMALRMLSELCGDDAHRWQEAEGAAVCALESRLRFWDQIHAQVVGSSSRHAG